MDWITFLFGALTGALGTITLFALIAWRGMRPYMKAVHNRNKGGGSVSPPINWDATGNDPVGQYLRGMRREN